VRVDGMGVRSFVESTGQYGDAYSAADAELLKLAEKNGNTCTIYGCYSPRNPKEPSLKGLDIKAIIEELNGMKCNDKCTTETVSIVIGSN
jgi:hypothetical protein